MVVKSVKFIVFECWVVNFIRFYDLGMFGFFVVVVESGSYKRVVVETSGSDEGDPLQTGR